MTPADAAPALPRAYHRLMEPASRDDMPPRHSMSAARLVPLAVFGIAAIYVAWHLGRGWIPNDDGSLAHSAERVMRGEMPHRDFDEIYTGGLSHLNAAAFRTLGTTLWSMRFVLFVVFLAWVPAVYAIASRFARPFAAGAVTLLAVAWSLPNYPAPMPSWYNLFLATFGVAALFRFLESGRRGWLVAAGVAGGLSFLVKVVGLYYVAAVLLFLVFHAHERTRAESTTDARPPVVYAAFVSLALVTFVGVLAMLVRRQLHAAEVVHFVVPGALIAGLLVRNEWMLPAGDSGARFKRLARLGVPFLLGVAVPVVLFLVPYARAGALDAFMRGVFILPAKRLDITARSMVPLWTMLALVPSAALALRARARVGRLELALIGLVLVGLLVATGSAGAFYRGVWFSMRSLVPVLVFAGVIALATERAHNAEAPLLRERTMLLLSVTALCSLVQFPFSIPLYFCYVAPLVVLTALALSRYHRPVSAAVPGVLIAFYLAFAVLRVNTSPSIGMGIVYRPYVPYLATAPLTVARGKLEVPYHQAMTYNLLVPILRARARGGYTWASPDCPEVYFLADLKNPTRTLFDFFDDSTGRTGRVLEALDAHGVTAIAMKRSHGFSPAISPELAGALALRYPLVERVGPFDVRWRP